MSSVEFLVQGSAPQPYRVTFERSDGRLSAFCTCPAGDKGQACKHRFNILKGETGAVIHNAHQVAVVATWLTSTQLETALADLNEAEKALDKAQKLVTAAKKKVAAAMHT